MGTEPFWNLTIDGTAIRFDEANAPGKPIVQRLPAVTQDGGARVYRAGRIVVRISQARCSDGMSDRIFPDTVVLTVDGRTLAGCGGDPLPPDSLVDTSWRVDAINGRVTPEAGDFTIVFAADTISGSFGCNRFNVAYRREERRIVPARPPAATRRSCPDMTFESQGLALLSRPAALVAEAGERISLNNEAGSMTLRRMH